MRDWSRMDGYLNVLLSEVYPQPIGENDEHPALAREVIDLWMSRLTGCNTVLDVGCGEGFAQPIFERWGAKYEGVSLSTDVIAAQKKGRNVKKMDFSFLEYDENSFDLVFSRHSLEHSPMPLLTLMEWARVSKQWLGLIVPAPEWYTFRGLNHYSVMTRGQLESIMEPSGWRIIWSEIGYKSRGIIADQEGKEVLSPPEIHEYRLFCEKKR